MSKQPIYFLLGDFLGKYPRRCRFIRQVFAPGWPQQNSEWWIIDTYPPIAGISSDGTVIIGFMPGQSFGAIGKRTVMVDVAISSKQIEGDRFDPRDFARLDIGDLVLPEQVSPRAFPFPFE